MKSSMNRLTDFLAKLDAERIDYTLAHQRDNAVLVSVAIPGERWEVEFFVNGSVEVERFVSSGEIYDEAILTMLFERYADDSDGIEDKFLSQLVPVIG